MGKTRRSPIFGSNVNRLRETAGLSQVGLAEKLRVKQTDISRWEHGSVPSIDTVVRLAAVLHSSLDELLHGIDQAYDASRALPAPRPRTIEPKLTPFDRELIDLWRNAVLPATTKTGLLDVLRGSQRRKKETA